MPAARPHTNANNNSDVRARTHTHTYTRRGGKQCLTVVCAALPLLQADHVHPRVKRVATCAIEVATLFTLGVHRQAGDSAGLLARARFDNIMFSLHVLRAITTSACAIYALIFPNPLSASAQPPTFNFRCLRCPSPALQAAN